MNETPEKQEMRPLVPGPQALTEIDMGTKPAVAGGFSHHYGSCTQNHFIHLVFNQ